VTPMQPVHPEVTLALLHAAGALCFGLLVAIAMGRPIVRRLRGRRPTSAAGTTRCRRCRRATRSFVAAVAEGDNDRAERAAARVLRHNDPLTVHEDG